MKETATAELSSSYREWLPPASWRGSVVCLWEQRVVGGRHVQRVVPDGCADIVVHDDGRVVLAGPARQVSLPQLQPGLIRGLRLRCEAIGAVFQVAAWELADATVALDQVVSTGRAQMAADVLMTGPEGPAGRNAGLDAGFNTRLPVSPWWADVVTDDRLPVACRALLAGYRPITEVAATVGVSTRQLRRLLLEATGYGPKTLQRVGRLQRFLHLVDEGPPAWSLAQLAATAGYADQAHLSREAREMTGATPSVLLRERHPDATSGAGEHPR